MDSAAGEPGSATRVDAGSPELDEPWTDQSTAATAVPTNVTPPTPARSQRPRFGAAAARGATTGEGGSGSAAASTALSGTTGAVWLAL